MDGKVYPTVKAHQSGRSDCRVGSDATACAAWASMLSYNIIMSVTLQECRPHVYTAILYMGLPQAHANTLARILRILKKLRINTMNLGYSRAQIEQMFLSPLIFACTVVYSEILISLLQMISNDAQPRSSVTADGTVNSVAYYPRSVECLLRE